MYTPGQQQLQSATWLQNYSGDRPSFQANVRRTLSSRPYQVFVMPQGLLFLELRHKLGCGGNNNNNAVVIGAVMGGMIGACIGAAIAGADAGAGGRIENFESCTEQELFELAAKRRRSFTSRIDEILSVRVDAPGCLSRLLADSTLAGWVTLRDRKLGKVSMHVYDQGALSVAVDALPRRLRERAFINVELDRHTAKFRPRGR
jgi:hypothetical protein